MAITQNHVSRFALGLLAALLWLGVGGGSAFAGEYEVRSCAASSAKRSDAWVATVDAGRPIEALDWCVSGQQGTDGEVVFSSARFVRPILPPPGPAFGPAGRAAGLTFVAPPGATLKRIDYRRDLQSLDQSWQVQLRSGAAIVESCEVPLGHYVCPDLYGGNPTFDLAAGTSELDLAAWCIVGPCPYGAGPLVEFAAVIYSSVVTVEEHGAPAVGAPNVAGLSNGWIGTGAASASLAGSDQLGLRRLELVEDDAVLATLTKSGCVDWSIYPCSEPGAGLSPAFSGTVSLNAIPEGEHVVRARATDAAGNTALSAPVTLKVDRTPPVAVGLSEGGVASARTREFSWFVPLGGSPIVTTRVRVCTGRGAPSSCRWEPATADGPLLIDTGEDGDVTTAQIEMTDQVGNVGITSAVEYRRDASAPAPPQLTVEAGSGARRALTVTAPDPDVAEYIVRVCSASGCTEQRRAPSARIEVQLPGPASYRVEVALVDRVGNVGAAAAANIDYAQPLRATELALKSPKKLPRLGNSLTLKGTIAPGAASKITARVKGRPAGRKRDVTYKASVKPSKAGKWSVRVKLPRGVSRRRGVLVTVTATPAAGFSPAAVTRRVRR